MKATLLGIAMICAVPVTAMAGQCPALHTQMEKAVGNRFDAGASNARQAMAKANALHRDGKHADSVKTYEDAAKAANIKLEVKK